MIQKVELFYSIPVIDGTEYYLKVRVGNAQPGDINVVYANCHYETEPTDNEEEWITKLDFGKQLKDKKILLSTLTKNENDLTNKVSVSVFINDKEVIPQSHSNDEDPQVKEVENNALVQFKQKIVFL